MLYFSIYMENIKSFSDQEIIAEIIRQIEGSVSIKAEFKQEVKNEFSQNPEEILNVVKKRIDRLLNGAINQWSGHFVHNLGSIVFNNLAELGEAKWQKKIYSDYQNFMVRQQVQPVDMSAFLEVKTLPMLHYFNPRRPSRHAPPGYQKPDYISREAVYKNWTAWEKGGFDVGDLVIDPYRNERYYTLKVISVIKGVTEKVMVILEQRFLVDVPYMKKDEKQKMRAGIHRGVPSFPQEIQKYVPDMQKI